MHMEVTSAPPSGGVLRDSTGFARSSCVGGNRQGSMQRKELHGEMATIAGIGNFNVVFGAA